MVPFDKKVVRNNGIRINVCKTRGMGKEEMKYIVKWIDVVIKNYDDKAYK